MFMQEVAILQMQAEGWKAEWSIAMQENERLRMALYDAQSALDALPPKEDGAPAAAPKPASEEELQVGAPSANEVAPSGFPRPPAPPRRARATVTSWAPPRPPCEPPPHGRLFYRRVVAAWRELTLLPC